MGFKDFLKRGTGLELVAGDASKDDGKPSGVGSKQKKANNPGIAISSGDEKVLRQLEVEVSRAIEKLEDIRDKLRVRRGF
ncbi:hypothetical protein HYV89_04135 [Candidatus Woesearchaeota archaeon]|nr:hypothetical protein [Candidatus Woesearchaeota archaeon]